MKLRTTYLFFISLFMILGNSLQAQLLAGGEIYYELVGPKSYKVTATVYRKCGDLPLTGINGYVIADAMTASLTFNRVAISKINDTCGNPCNVENQVSNPGFERHTFVGYVDFINDNNYTPFVSFGKCDITFAVRNGGRDNMTTTQKPAMFYIEAGVELCDTNIKSNHSPIFSMDPKFMAACNQPIRYSPGPMDSVDYDSLAFSIEPVLQDYQKSISYKSPFSYDIPLTPYCPPDPGVVNCRALPNAKPPRGFYFDPVGCHIVLTPNKCDDLGYVRLKIREFRRINGKMVLLGHISREMLVQVISVADNNPPYITTSPSGTVICGNLNIKTFDNPFLPKQTKLDTTYIFWDQGYKNGKMIIYADGREKSADIILPGNDQNTMSKQPFTIGTYDKKCNIAINTQTFIGINYPTVYYKTSYTVDSCNILKYIVKPIDSSVSIGGNVQIYTASGTNVGASAKMKDSFQLNTSGKHIIKYSVIAAGMGPCFTTRFDTIEIVDAFPKGQLNQKKDTNVCSSYPAILAFNPSKVPGLKSIQWFKNDTLVNTVDSQIAATIYNPTLMRLYLTSDKNCHSESKVNYSIKKISGDLLGLNPDTICGNDEVLVIPTVYSPKFKYPVHFQWKINGVVYPKDTHFLRLHPAVNTDIRLIVKDDNHCTAQDSLFVPVAVPSSFILTSDKPEICRDSSMTVSLQNFKAAKPVQVVWTFNHSDSLFDITNVTRNYSQATTLVVTIKDRFGCKVTDSTRIDPVTVPAVGLPVTKGFCSGGSEKIVAVFNPNVYPKTLSWSLNGATFTNPDSFYIFSEKQSGTVGLQVKNRLGCGTEASTNVTVHPLPVPQIVSDTFYHPTNTIMLSTTQAYKTYLWFNGEVARNNRIFSDYFPTLGKHRVWVLVKDQNNCSGSDSLDIYNDRFTDIQPILLPYFVAYPNPAIGELYIETSTNGILNICSLDGKSVMTVPVANGKNTINISGLAKGLYLLSVQGQSILLLKE